MLVIKGSSSGGVGIYAVKLYASVSTSASSKSPKNNLAAVVVWVYASDKSNPNENIFLDLAR